MLVASISNCDMENSNKHRKNLDRLSELPDSLIFEIFSFLPITDVVRTTILSKRWRDLWKTVPFLNLRDSNTKFANQALSLWGGVKILKLTMNFEHERRDIDAWVRFAVDKAAEELQINLNDYLYNAHTPPQFLYSCSSLQALSFKNCCLRIDKNVKWDRLKSLTIDENWYGSDCLSQDGIDQILRGSPNLSVLIFSTLDVSKKLCFRSSSLKKLSVAMPPEEWPWGDGELEILAPKLETLEVSGAPYRKWSLSAPFLTRLALGFYGHENCWYDHELNVILEGTLRQILPTIPHVESVTLSYWCIKVLWAMKSRRCLLSPFPNVEFLKIHAGFSEKHQQIASLLEIFPMLKRLIVVEEENDKSLKFRANVSSEEEFEANLSKSFLQELRMVEVGLAERDFSIFPFIKILLKYASKLEKMVIRGKDKLLSEIFLNSTVDFL